MATTLFLILGDLAILQKVEAKEIYIYIYIYNGYIGKATGKEEIKVKYQTKEKKAPQGITFKRTLGRIHIMAGLSNVNAQFVLGAFCQALLQQKCVTGVECHLILM